jgi:hypothetical protein
MTPELEDLAIERLDDPDLEVVTNAASALGQYGSTGRVVRFRSVS